FEQAPDQLELRAPDILRAELHHVGDTVEDANSLKLPIQRKNGWPKTHRDPPRKPTHARTPMREYPWNARPSLSMDATGNVAFRAILPPAHLVGQPAVAVALQQLLDRGRRSGGSWGCCCFCSCCCSRSWSSSCSCGCSRTRAGLICIAEPAPCGP